jgi:hypothetical protein
MMPETLTLAPRNVEPLTGVPLDTIAHTYQLTIRSSDPGEAPGQPSTIRLEQGAVILDGLTLSSPKLGAYYVGWGQPTPQGHSFGRLHIAKDRLSLSGVIGSSSQAGPPSVFRVIGVAEPQQASLPDGRSLSFQYEPDRDHPGRVVPSMRLDGAPVSGELNTHLLTDGTLQLEHPSLPQGVALTPRGAPAPPATNAFEAKSSLGIVSPAQLTPQALAQQNIENIEADSQAAFLANFKWALEPAWSQPFLPSTVVATTDPNLTCLVDQDAEWFNATYAPAFIGYGLSKAETSNAKVTLSTQDVNRLNYFLTDGLAADPSYMQQSNVSMIPAAIAATQSASPNLGDYLGDTTHPQGYWADQLLAYLTSPAQLQIIYDAAPDANGNMQNQELQNIMQDVNTNAMLLAILDVSGVHSQAYYDAVYSAVFGGLLQNATVSQDPAFYQSWLATFISQFITYYEANLNSPPSSGPELVMYTTGEDFKTAADALGGANDLANIIAQAFSKPNPTTSLLALSQGAASAFNNAAYQQTGTNDVAQAIDKYFLVIASAGVFITTLLSLADVNEMDPEQLTSTINTLVGIMANAVDSLPDLLDAASWVYSKTDLFFALVENAIFSDLSASTKLIAAGGATAQSVASWMSARVQNNAIATAGTSFATYLRNAAMVARFVGVIVSVVSLGLTIWQLVTDILSGADTLTVVLGAVSVAAAAFSFAASMATMALVTSETIIPAIIGAVAALAGVVVGIIASIFQQEPPPNPVDVYLQTVVTPFAGALPDPSADWPGSANSEVRAAIGARVAAKLAAFRPIAVPVAVTA